MSEFLGFLRYFWQAQEAIQRATISSEYEYIDQVLEGSVDTSKNMSPFLSSTYRPCIPQSKFDVSIIVSTKKYSLSVKIEQGLV